VIKSTSGDSSRKFKFSGHQTFAFRFGWLEKGVRGVHEHHDLFSREDALVLLGVGKNMVESIRHWCCLAQLIEVARSADDECHALRPTEIASSLLLDGGWDPFFEDDASLWLIHWLIATNPEIGTCWHLLFACYNRPEFSRREFAAYVKDFVQREKLRVGDAVLTRDVDCLIRTYLPAAGSSKQPLVEESFACPLIQLNLIQPSLDGEMFRFAIGPKPSLPPAIFALALHQHFEREGNRMQTMSIQECLYGEGSPGQVFKLDENSLIEYIEDLEDLLGGRIVLDETAGLKQIYRRERFEPVRLLKNHYGGRRKK
jgi:hypothetical protein